MPSTRGIALILALCLVPAVAFAGAIHVPDGAGAIGVSGSAYRASEHDGFEGTVSLTMRGVLDLGFSVQRSEVDADTPASSYSSTGPTAYLPGATMTTYEPYASYTVHLPREYMVSVEGACQLSRDGVSTREVDGVYAKPAAYFLRTSYSQLGLRFLGQASRRYKMGYRGCLIPRFGLEYRYGRLEAKTAVLNDGDLSLRPAVVYSPVVTTSDEFGVVAGVDAVVHFGRQQFSIGPEVSLGQDTNSARIVMGYSLVSR